MSRNRWLVTAAVTALLLFIPLARAETSVTGVAQDEIAGIQASGFPLPPFELVTIDRWNSAGNSIILPSPRWYVIVLWNYYFSEDQVRKVTAHEVAHILMAGMGMGQSEETADQFAACFGSEGAKRWATQVEKTQVSPKTCALLRNELNPP